MMKKVVYAGKETIIAFGKFTVENLQYDDQLVIYIVQKWLFFLSCVEYMY